MNPSEIERSSILAATFLKGLANANRLKILCFILGEVREVSEIVERTGLSQSAVSQHLKKMRDEGFVECKKNGRKVGYFISNPDVLKVMSCLYEIFCKKPS